MKVPERKNNELVNIWIVSRLVEVLEGEGFSSDDVLSDIKLSKDRLSEVGSFVPVIDYINCIEKCVTLTGIPYLGLIESKYFRVLDPGLISYAMFYSRDLVQALDALIKYWPLDGFFSGKIYVTDSLVFELHDLAEHNEIVNRYFAESMLTGIADVLRYNNPMEKILSKVCFQFDGSQHRHLYEEIFNCPIEFNNKHNQIVFRQSAMQQVQLHYNPELYLTVQKQCEEKLALLEVENDIVNSIYKILFSHQTNFPNIDDVAAMFNTSTATLKRWLALKETTYKSIVTNYRITQASRLLSETEIPIAEIAELIGYKNSNNFSRAFSKSMLCSPSEYRKNSLEN